ncbi:CDP-alcohol phosphatidyltransferase family protein [Angustibacter peucedani]
MARPFVAARVAPDVLTVLGLLVACAVVPLAALGGRWPLLAALVVVVSGLADNLDGAVAVITGRTTRWGAVLDALCDRVADGAAVVALAVLGAPPWLAALAAGTALAHEYLRARATAAGLDDAGVITVAERPTRIIGATAFLLGAGLYAGSASSWATAGAAFLAAVGAVGLAQLLVVVRRRLR